MGTAQITLDPPPPHGHRGAVFLNPIFYTGCPRKKSTIKCVSYLQVLLKVSRKTVCHKQGR